MAFKIAIPWKSSPFCPPTYYADPTSVIYSMHANTFKTKPSGPTSTFIHLDYPRVGKAFRFNQLNGFKQFEKFKSDTTRLFPLILSIVSKAPCYNYIVHTCRRREEKQQIV